MKVFVNINRLISYSKKGDNYLRTRKFVKEMKRIRFELNQGINAIRSFANETRTTFNEWKTAFLVEIYKRGDCHYFKNLTTLIR